MEKWLCWAAMGIAFVILFFYGLDLLIGWPFGRAGGGAKGIIQDLVFVLGSGLVLWLGYETWREMA